MKFVIFHGSFGSSTGNWFPDLKEKLEFMGQTVICPQFPVDDKSNFPLKLEDYKTKQNLNSWTQTFEKEVLPELKGKEKICFVGHSLGNVFILHIIEKFKIKLDCAIFVSPFLDKLLDIPIEIDKVNQSFYKTDFNFEFIKKYIPTSYVLYSDTDPYVKPHLSLHFAKVLDSSHILVRKAGHLNASVGINEFPMVYDLCVSRLDLTLYQKFAYKRSIVQSLKNLTFPENQVMHLTPEDMQDEGTFHSMNLSIGGFATFPTNTQDIDPDWEYYRNGRAIATNGHEIVRVYIVMNPSDLLDKTLLRQINLDIKGNIKCSLLDYKYIHEFNCELDFGIWDNSYVCILHRDKNGDATEMIIDSRAKTLLTAQNWRDRIIRAATKIEKLSDITKFINT